MAVTASMRRLVKGQRRLVTLAPHNWNDDILAKTLASIIRPSGLSRQSFR